MVDIIEWPELKLVFRGYNFADSVYWIKEGEYYRLANLEYLISKIEAIRLNAKVKKNPVHQLQQKLSQTTKIYCKNHHQNLELANGVYSAAKQTITADYEKLKTIFGQPQIVQLYVSSQPQTPQLQAPPLETQQLSVSINQFWLNPEPSQVSPSLQREPDYLGLLYNPPAINFPPLITPVNNAVPVIEDFIKLAPIHEGDQAENKKEEAYRDAESQAAPNETMALGTPFNLRQGLGHSFFSSPNNSKKHGLNAAPTAEPEVNTDVKPNELTGNMKRHKYGSGNG